MTDEYEYIPGGIKMDLSAIIVILALVLLSIGGWGHIPRKHAGRKFCMREIIRGRSIKAFHRHAV